MLPMALMILTNRLAETSFKDRYKNHITTFNNKQQKNKTELSKYVQSFKNENKASIINWKIMKKVYSKATSKFSELLLKNVEDNMG